MSCGISFYAAWTLLSFRARRLLQQLRLKTLGGNVERTMIEISSARLHLWQEGSSTTKSMLDVTAASRRLWISCPLPQMVCSFRSLLLCANLQEALLEERFLLEIRFVDARRSGERFWRVGYEHDPQEAAGGFFQFPPYAPSERLRAAPRDQRVMEVLLLRGGEEVPASGVWLAEMAGVCEDFWRAQGCGWREGWFIRLAERELKMLPSKEVSDGVLLCGWQRDLLLADRCSHQLVSLQTCS